MPNRLKDLEVQEVSLVDDPAVPQARFLITKRRDPAESTPTTPVTDTTEKSLIEKMGEAVMSVLGAAPADATTRRIIAKGLADAEAGDAPEAVEAEDVEKGKKCPGCGRFMTGESRHRDHDKDEKAKTEADAAEEEAEKADEAEEPAEEPEGEEAEEDEAEEPEEEAEKADEGDPMAELAERLSATVKETVEAELADIRESIGKSLDAAEDLQERVGRMEKRKGVSKRAKGAELEADEADDDSGLFDDVVYGGL